MKKHFLALSVSLALATNTYSVGMPEKLIIFGDSLSDNGNILRFTYNQENVYNEYLANYYGYNSPRHDGNFLTKRNQDGPNYALGGAVANDYLGGLQGALSPKLSDEINNYLNLRSRRNTQNQDYKYIFWIGGNDLRLADDDINLGDPNISTDQSQNKKIQGSIGAVETQLKKLLVKGNAKFVIVPNAPNIANTPNFTNNFLSDGRIYFNGWKSLLGGRKFLGFGGINKNDVIRFLDDQNNHGRPAKDVIYDAFEFVLRKHYNIPQGKPLTSAAFQELQQWKRQFERVYKAETSLVNTFNQGVDKVIENLKAQHPDVTFIRPNIQLLLDEVMSHYTEFGFNNVSGSAANPFTSAVVGRGAGKGRVAAFEPIDGQKGVKDKNYLWGKGYQFVFADQFHPSPKTHRMIADYIMSLLESESGDPTDLTVRRVSTTPFNSTANNIYHSAEGDGVFHVDMHSNDINKSNLNIFNDGRALFASNGGKIQLTNTNITSQGRLGGIINAELGGKIYLTNGHIDIYRTNPYVAPFGVMVNGQSSEVELNKIKLNTFGKETTAITVGNKATLRLQDSQIKTNGVGANVLNLWDSSATIINSTLNTESEGASAIRVFANDEGNLLSRLMMKGSTISAEHYAIKVAKNATMNLPVFEASISNSVINGGIYTEKNAKSYFTIDNNSQWNMSKNSSVYQLNLSDSSLNLSQTTDTWQPKTLEIYEGLIAQNARITLGTDLGNDNSQTDKISVSGDSIINGNLQIEKRYSSSGAKTQFGIKIIDLNANKVNIGNLTLANDVTAGLYQYVLSHGGIGADDQSDYYLTSTYIKQDNKISPVIIAPTLEETAQPVEKPVVPAVVIAKDKQAVPALAETAQPVEKPVMPAEVIAKNEQAVPALAETAQPVEKPVMPAEVIAKNEQAVPSLAETALPIEKSVAPALVIAKDEQAVPALAETVQPVEKPVMPAEVIAKNEQAVPALAETVQPVEEPVVPAEVIAKDKQAVPSLAETAQPVEKPVMPAEVIAKNEQAVPALAETAQPVEEPVVPAKVNTQSVPTSSRQGELAINELTKIQELNESNELDSSADIVKKRAKRNVEAPEVESLTTDSVDVYQDTPVVTAQNDTTTPASKAAKVQQDESGELNNSTNLDDSTAATNETTEQTPQSKADNSKTVLPTSITNGTPINRLLNADASLIAALPYISSYVGQLHLDYSRRNPNTPLWSQTSNLDYWVNMAYAHNDVKGKAFLNIKQNSQILAIGKDLVSNTDNLIGISATYSKTTSNVKNEINGHLNLNPYVGKVTSEMVSANGYFAHNWNNWYAQAIISAGRVIHDFKNKDKIRYKQNGYILSSEQNIGYRYPFNQDLTLYADLGLQESYHRYSAISVKDINVDAVRESQVNALINLGADYRVANFALSSNIRLIKNLRDFDHLIMNNEWIEDKFVKDSAALSANARYYFTDNISTFINLEYLRSLTKEQKLRRMNYQVGMSIQF
ncbi:autotransporter domain-containing protein [Gallibacterium anatis]|uniref:autotransporter domain-containing protein n=1 Tax=Gallibacterium anatis TaxID=750 RepID=UPI0039FC6147